MSLTTPRSIITLALKDAGVIGVGQTASFEDANDAFDKLNMIVGLWNADRWMLYHLIDVAKVSTGASSYTVAVGDDFDTPRPDRIEAAFLRQYPTNQQPVDTPMRILNAREDYNRITVKLTTGPSMYAFYDAAYPVGVYYPWPVSQATIYEYHISVRDQLTAFATLDTPVNLPAIYTPAMLYTLACWLRPGYQLEADPQIVQIAMRSLAVMRGSNAQIPKLRMPAAVIGYAGRYNIWGDSINSGV
jgi:hypothetical protein